MGLIDLNTTEEDETPSSDSSASSWCSAPALSASAPASASSVCLELWHACAGPLISLPKKNSVVVYFPQGHMEQVPDFPLAACDLPSHVFCRVVDVKLHVSTSMMYYVCIHTFVCVFGCVIEFSAFVVELLWVGECFWLFGLGFCGFCAF